MSETAKRPTLDELKALDERVRRFSALIDIGAQVVRGWDDSHGCCPWCISGDDSHERGCPGPLVEAFLDNHGRV